MNRTTMTRAFGGDWHLNGNYNREILGMLGTGVAFTKSVTLSPPCLDFLSPTALTARARSSQLLGPRTKHYLDEHLAQERHDEGRVHAAEPAHRADSQLPDLKHLVVQSHK